MDAWDQLLGLFPNQKALADRLEISPQLLSWYIGAQKPPKVVWCIRAEIISNGKVRARELRPDARDPDRWDQVES